MKKNDLLKLFPTVSPTVVNKTDDGYEIVGKFCGIYVFDDGNISFIEKRGKKRKLIDATAIEAEVTTFLDRQGYVKDIDHALRLINRKKR